MGSGLRFWIASPRSERTASHVPNPRSGCQHKAWGGAKRNPRYVLLKVFKPAERATAPATAIDVLARAACWIPSLPLGYRYRPLRGLTDHFWLWLLGLTP